MFRKDFLWGAASAGRQVESARLVPGEIAAGDSDWEVFASSADIRERIRTFSSKAPGFPNEIVYEQPEQGIGYDSLEVIRADLERARALGLNAWRFSIEWSRLQPERGTPDTDPVLDATWVDHYLDVVGELTQRTMTPVISLNHMSLPAWALTPPVATRVHDPFSGLPAAVADEGFNASLRGWENDATVEAWGRFVKAFATALRGRFPDLKVIWLTLNEPIGSMVGAGYLGAIWVPGFTGEAERGRRVALGLVKAHVRAYRELKAVSPDYQVSFAHAMQHAVTTSFPAAVAGLEVGGAVGGALGASLGALAGAGVGAVNGALLCAMLGPLALACLVAAVIAGAITGAVAGGVAGGAAGAALGALAGEAGQVQTAARERYDYFLNEWMLRALAKGEIDTELRMGADWPPVEWDRIWTEQLGPDAGPRGPRLDFVGVNYYRQVHVYYFPPSTMFVPYTGGLITNDMEGNEEPHGVLNELGWEVLPRGISSFARRIHDTYALPLLITENGAPDKIDANRGPNLVAHLRELDAVMQEADPPRILGYLHWTLVHNWEWHEGYHDVARFGIYTTGGRDTGNIISHGAASTFRRQLGEGGLALRSVIENGATALARRSIGAISPAGERTEPGDRSHGGLWEGELGGQSVKLFLDSTAAGVPSGLIYYRAENAWVPLERLEWDAAGQALSFTHSSGRSLPQVPAREVRLQLNPGTKALTGQAMGAGGPSPVDLSLAPLHGLWLAEAAGDWLAVGFQSLQDAGPVGKRLLAGDGQRWQAFAVSGTPPGFRLGSDTFSVRFGADPRDLTVVPTSGADTFARTFRRAPSSLGILREV